MDVNQLSDVVEKFYGAAYGRDTWPDAMVSLSSMFGGSRACMFTARMDNDGHVQSVDRVVGSCDDPDFVSGPIFDEILHDPVFQSFGTTYFASPTGSLVLWRDVVDIDEFRRGEFWNRWLKPRDMFEDARQVLDSGAATGVNRSVGISRGRNQGVFGDEERKIFALVARHLRRAAEMGELLEMCELDGVAMEAMPFGVLIAERTGRVRRMNIVAERLLERIDTPVTVRGGMLAAVTAPDALALAAQLASAFAPPGDADAQGALVLPCAAVDNGGRDRLLVSAAPLIDSPLFERRGEACAVVTLRELRTPPDQALAGLISKLFGLSPSHARLAARLSSGISLKEAGTANGITYATARSYLEVILHKTGARRQTELVALLKSIELMRLR